MAFIIYIIYVALIQLATGQVPSINGQGAINTLRYLPGNPLSTGSPLPSNAPFTRGPRTVPVTNQLAGNPVTTGNGLAGVLNRNLAKSNVVTGTNPILATANTASQSLVGNIASTNVAAAVDARKINNPNLLNTKSGVVSQAPLYMANPKISSNIANSLASSKYLGSSYSPAQNYNLANSNYVSNLANGNIASANRANLANGWIPSTGNSYTKSIVNGPVQYGIQVQADGLEISGNVEVTGNLPFSGTVSLNGNLPTGGSATVDYACLS